MADGVLDIDAYLLDPAAHDWAPGLAAFCPPLPTEFTIAMVTRFLDFFLVYEDGSVNWLDPTSGSLLHCADSREEFSNYMLIEYPNWLSTPFVDGAVARGLVLQPGQCYAFTHSPMLGGDYSVDNVEVVDVGSALARLGAVFRQTREGQVLNTETLQ